MTTQNQPEWDSRLGEVPKAPADELASIKRRIQHEIYRTKKERALSLIFFSAALVTTAAALFFVAPSQNQRESDPVLTARNSSLTLSPWMRGSPSQSVGTYLQLARNIQN